MLFYFSLAILVFVLGAQLWLRFFINRGGLTRVNTQINADIFKYIFLISLFLIFSLLFYQSFKQYQLWSQNEISQYLLPPYRSINYFIFYVFRRIFAPYLISLTVAILFSFTAKLLNKKYEERFFYPEEYYLGALAIFLMSHPGWLFYLIFLIFIYLLIHFYSLLITHYSLQRISLYYLWIPTAIFVILISKWVEHLSLWSLLKI